MIGSYEVVPEGGLEPPCTQGATDFESVASTNSATPASEAHAPSSHHLAGNAVTVNGDEPLAPWRFGSNERRAIGAAALWLQRAESIELPASMSRAV